MELVVYVLGLYWDYIGIKLGLYWDYIWDYMGHILGSYWDFERRSRWPSAYRAEGIPFSTSKEYRFGFFRFLEVHGFECSW